MRDGNGEAEDDPLDPTKLRLTPELMEAGFRAQAEKAKKKASQTGKAGRPGEFIMMPLHWHLQLIRAPRTTLWLAGYLAYLSWKANGRPFKLANTGLLNLGVTRFSKWRALRDLERRGWIKVHGDPRKSPTITVFPPGQ